jgi:hypothetical protein
MLTFNILRQIVSIIKKYILKKSNKIFKNCLVWFSHLSGTTTWFHFYNESWFHFYNESTNTNFSKSYTTDFQKCSRDDKIHNQTSSYIDKNIFQKIIL